eukprot:TRINITY_DN2903_c0_g1_i1.p1 TRINITY_DN2903_c0_g1~~TRINITY_DN2903_c0_g1_i1.p1  ORF type:complete len:665 (-),score=232.69 TRINITY_DN2903_c0_g1_i1:50-2044(-)
MSSLETNVVQKEQVTTQRVTKTLDEQTMDVEKNIASGIGNIVDPQLKATADLVTKNALTDDKIFIRVPTPPPLPTDDWKPEFSRLMKKPLPAEIENEMRRKQRLRDMKIVDPLDNEALRELCSVEGSFIGHKVLPCEEYSTIVIGGGQAGITAALEARNYGSSVALIERNVGDSMLLANSEIGIISLSAAAEKFKEAMKLYKKGFITRPKFNWESFQDKLEQQHYLQYLKFNYQKLRENGVDIFVGNAKFMAEDIVKVGDHEIKFHRAIVATGVTQTVPDITNLKEIGFLTPGDIFTLEKLPSTLAIIGSSPKAVELAQSLSSLGTHVHLITSGTILPNFDDCAVEVVRQALMKDHISLNEKTNVISVEKRGKLRSVYMKTGQIKVDQILVACGGMPNTEALDCHNAKITCRDNGLIKVNKCLQTHNPKIFAIGSVATDSYDVAWQEQSINQARLAVSNSINKTQHASRLSPLLVYSQPQIAQFGESLTFLQTEKKYKDKHMKTFTLPLDRTMKSQIDDDRLGYVTLVVDKDGKIYGATVVDRNAEEIIQPLCFAIHNKLKIEDLTSSFAGYPSKTAVIRDLANIVAEQIKHGKIRKQEEKRRENKKKEELEERDRQVQPEQQQSQQDQPQQDQQQQEEQQQEEQDQPQQQQQQEQNEPEIESQ